MMRPSEVLNRDYLFFVGGGGKLALAEAGIFAAKRLQLCVAAHLNQPPLLEDKDAVSRDDRAETVGDDEAGAVFLQTL